MSRGTLLCLASAAAFGAMAIFGKLAYDEGVGVGTLLSARFLLAAVVFWGLVVVSGQAGALRGLGRRTVLIALALGAFGYSAQAGAYFAALERIDASLLALLLYTFPAIVTVAAIALGRERISARKVVSLSLASAGLALVVAGAGTGALDPLGTALGVAAALVYSTYILVSDGVVDRLAPLLLSALVCTGAAVTLTVGGTALGQIHPGDVTLAGLGWLAALSLVSTVAAISLFFAGLRHVGPSTASILSTVEPLVTVVLAFVVFSETLTPVQVLGGALVLGAVVVLNARLPTLQRRTAAIAAGFSRGTP